MNLPANFKLASTKARPYKTDPDCFLDLPEEAGFVESHALNWLRGAGFEPAIRQLPDYEPGRRDDYLS
jgi:hypothetical protein